MNRRVPSCLAALPLALAAGLCQADGPSTEGWTRVHDWDDEDRSHDRARRASAAGEILPIAEIYERARRQQPGRILEAELERAHGRWIYELKILDPAGRLYELKLDAATGELLRHEEDRD